MSFPVRALAAAALAALLLAPASCGPRPEPRPPNIILVSIDSLRADHVRSYGYERETTPHLDRIAREGAAFETAVAESSWTIPSHATLLTGVGSRVHGMETGYVRLSPRRRTLAHVLKEHGYRTAGVFSGPYLHPVFGFDQGFDTYESVIPALPMPPGRAGPAPGTDAVNRIMESQEEALRRPTGAAVTDRALRLLQEAAGRPFFLFLHYFDVHYDYDPPEPYWRRFDPDYRGTFTGRDFVNNPDIHDGMNAVALRHLLARYDGEILYTDEQIGRLVDALDRNGLSASTLLLVTSDHGDEFFEHEDRGHRRSLFEETVRVPLVVRFPGRVPAGRRIGGLARHVDVAPTLLAYAGIRAPMEGVDLRPSLESGLPPPVEYAVSRLVRNPVKNEWVSVRTRERKYILRRQGDRRTELLYDLRTDPGEHDPIMTVVRRSPEEPDPAGPLSRARSLLVEWDRRARPDRVVGLDKPGDLSPEMLERLRALGYVQ